jgi:hypothetical protein
MRGTQTIILKKTHGIRQHALITDDESMKNEPAVEIYCVELPHFESHRAKMSNVWLIATTNVFPVYENPKALSSSTSATLTQSLELRSSKIEPNRG